MDEAWVRSVIAKNARHIRQLTTKWTLTLEACVQSRECTNVTALKASIIPECSSSYELPPYISQWEHWVPDIPASFLVIETIRIECMKSGTARTLPAPCGSCDNSSSTTLALKR